MQRITPNLCFCFVQLFQLLIHHQLLFTKSVAGSDDYPCSATPISIYPSDQCPCGQASAVIIGPRTWHGTPYSVCLVYKATYRADGCTRFAYGQRYVFFLPPPPPTHTHTPPRMSINFMIVVLQG